MTLSSPLLQIVGATLSLNIAYSSLAHATLWPSTANPIQEELSSPDSAVRRAAIRQLAKFSRDEAFPLLRKGLEDPDLEVRVQSAQVAAQQNRSEIAEMMLQWLTSTEARLREAACLYFKKVTYPKSTKWLTRALSDTEPSVRLAAVQALSSVQSNDVLASLLTKLNDMNSQVRVAAVQILAKSSEARVITPLLSKVQDESEDVRKEVIRALGHFGYSQASPALIAALRDPSYEVRIEALHALGRMRSNEAVASIASLVFEPFRKTGPKSDQRRIAFRTLAQIGTPAAIDVIAQALGFFEDSYAQLNTSATREAAIAIGTPMVPVLTEFLRNGTFALSTTYVPTRDRSYFTEQNIPIERRAIVATSVAYILGKLRVKESGPDLVQAMRRGLLSVESALYALAEIGDPQFLSIGLESITSPDAGVRTQALRLISRSFDQDNPDGRAVEPLLTVLKAAQNKILFKISEQEQLSLLSLLGSTRAARVAPALIPFTNAKENAIRLAAIDALGWLVTHTLDDVFFNLMKDPSNEIRMHAAIALGRAGSSNAIARIFKNLFEATEVDRLGSMIALGGLLERHAYALDFSTFHRTFLLLNGERDLFITAIARSQNPSRITLLRSLLETSSSDLILRRTIALSLGAHVRDKAAMPLLSTLLKDPDASVRAQAAWSFGVVAEHYDSTLFAPLLHDASAIVTANAVAALGRILVRSNDPNQPIAEVCNALRHPHAYVRSNALSSLVLLAQSNPNFSCDDGSFERQLLVEDPNEMVRSAAARVVHMQAQKLNSSQKLLAQSSLDKCAKEDVSNAVASLCQRSPNLQTSQSTSSSLSTLVVFIAPTRANDSTLEQPYALERPEGLLHLGISDRLGAVVEMHLPKGQIRLQTVSPVSRSVEDTQH